MKTYEVKFVSGNSDVRSTFDIESIDKFLESLDKVAWVTLNGYPTITVRKENIESIKFTEVVTPKVKEYKEGV